MGIHFGDILCDRNTDEKYKKYKTRIFLKLLINSKIKKHFASKNLHFLLKIISLFKLHFL